MYPFVLVLQFLTKLRFPADTPVAEIIRRRYGRLTWIKVRRWEKSLQCWKKAKLDVTFIEKCLQYDLTPKFVRFKLYNRSLYKKQFYKEWQQTLLEEELKRKRKKVNSDYEKLLKCYNEVKQELSYLDFNHVLHFIHKNVDRYVDKLSLVHAKKIFLLGGFYKPMVCDHKKTVINLSDCRISDRTRWLLAFGLDHNFRPKLDEFSLKLSLECLAHRLSNNTAVQNRNLNEMYGGLRNIYNSVTSEYKKEVKIDIFTRKDLFTLKSLGKNENIVIRKPDKGRGVVIMNKQDYIDKMNIILDDTSCFVKCAQLDPEKNTILLEDRLNRTLKDCEKKGYFSKEEYQHLRAVGSSPSVLYGLPKLHKENIPLRPVLSALGAQNYKLSKFIIPYIKDFSNNEYTLSSSSEICEILKNTNCLRSHYMTSFDIESLYTNVPIDEAINITANYVYERNGSFRGMSKSEFIKLLRLTTDNSYFIFNGNYFKQKDGLAMGGPISATLANIFLSFYEQKFLAECPTEFKPLLYRRYVDDTFVLFSHPDHAEQFFTYINSRHPKIKFTYEKENNSCLPFLDLLLKRGETCIDTSIYRKITFTGQSINYLSACNFRYKLNIFSTMLHRAYKLTSDYFSFHKELMFLENFFRNNGYHSNLFYRFLRTFLNGKYKIINKEMTVSKDKVYFRIPYISDKLNAIITKQLRSLISNYYPQLELIPIYYNNFKIASFFHMKDKLPVGYCSCVTYEFKCDLCSGLYIGSTIKTLNQRIHEHMAVSIRTGRYITAPVQSSIREHCNEVCNITVKKNSFSIVHKSRNENELRISESLLIKAKKPSINLELSAIALKIF